MLRILLVSVDIYHTLHAIGLAELVLLSILEYRASIHQVNTLCYPLFLSALPSLEEKDRMMILRTDPHRSP